MTKLIYKVADLDFIVETQNHLNLYDGLKSFQPFFVSESEIGLICDENTDIAGNDILFCYKAEAKFEMDGTLMKRFNWSGAECDIYRKDNDYYIRLQSFDGENGYMKASKEWSLIEVMIPDGKTKTSFYHNLFLMMAFAFSSMRSDTLMIHASVIEKDGRGVLFLGKSGTGKSTHTRLWLKNIEDCELLNDDNPIVRVFDDRVIVYGTPWSGKTDCYKNKSLPVAGFIRLKQASDNKLTRLAPALSFTSLLPSCSNMIWDEKINDMVCNAISKIVSLVPVYLLECLPDKGAVLMSKTILK